MKRMMQIASTAMVLAGGVHLSKPPTAGATMAPAPSPFGSDGVAYCCTTADLTKRCCFPRGCGINDYGCWQVG